MSLRLEISNDLNILADTPEELLETVNFLKENAGALADGLTDIKQVFLAKGAFTAPPAASTPPPAKATTPPASGKSYRCEHGEGKWASGTNKKTGAPYQGYYCPGRYPNQCKPSKLGD